MAKARQQYFADETTLQKESREFAITPDIINKLDSIETGAQVNVIETVKVNGMALVPDANKAVNVEVPDVIDNLFSTSTDDALSAKQGKVLYDYLQNIASRGRYLSNWNCVTGLAVTNPSENPYPYKAGDYYSVSNVAAIGGTNYRPDGAQYIIGQASTTVETELVSVSDFYLYDGTNWLLLANSARQIAVDSSLSTTSTNPVENRVVTNAINGKQDTLVAGTNIQIASDGKTISATDTTYSAGTNISIDANNEISAVDTTYTAGANIQISNQNVISATDTVYAAGTNVQINNNIISATDTTYTAGTGISIDSNNVISNTQTSAEWGNITGTLSDQTDLQDALDTKQNTLTAGTNIQIAQDGTISATDTTYTAGTGIDITNGVISNTQTSAEWGNITGTLSNQTDLQSALDAKQDDMVILSYGNSTWNDFITAYNKNAIVYCKASSNSNPGTGNQTRMAFMAYVSNPSSPTSVEFQYYRSRSDHNSAANQLDQVFVYQLTSSNGGTWTVTERNTAAKATAGTGISLTYSSGNMTISADTQYDNTAYGTSWDGVTNKAPTKNAVYDKISAMDTTIAGKQDTLTAGTGINIGSVNGRQGPAPDGFHIPSIDEWIGVRTIMNGLSPVTGPGDGWRMFLHMPFAGGRDYDASLYGQGSNGYYWSSSPNSAYARLLYLDTTYAYADYNPRAYGVSVRCFKDEYVAPDSNWTVVWGTLGSAGIFWNQSEGLISITNGTTGYTIMDKNLGATAVYNEFDTLTQANMGNMYQWGNNYGFPSTGEYSNTSSTQVDASGYGPSTANGYYESSTFITGGNDWSSVQNDDLWGDTTGIIENVISNTGVTSVNGQTGDVTISGAVWGSITGTLSDQIDLNNALGGKQDTLIAGTNISIASDGKTISATDTTYVAGDGISIGNATRNAKQGPAPDEFHVPSKDEWVTLYGILTTTFGLTSNGTTMQTYLKMPFAGGRSRYSSDISSQGTLGQYWSSTAYSTEAYYLYFTSSSLNPQLGKDRALGLSIRCFKDSPVIPTSSWTTLYDGSSIASGAGIFQNLTDGLISISGDGNTWYTIQDKNLGATTVYNSGDTLSEANCGYYYQRGNNYGFPGIGSSETITTSSTQVDTSSYGPGTSNGYYESSTFITGNSDWSSVQNDNLWGDTTGTYTIDNVISNIGVLSVNGQTGDVTLNAGDMLYSDFNWASKTGATITLDLASTISPSADFTVNAPSTIKDGQTYILRVNNEGTAYEMTLGTNVTNPYDTNITLTDDGVDQFVFLAINGELELQPEGGGGGGGDYQLAPNSPLKPKYRWYGTQAQYDALTQYYTDEEGDTVYFTI